MERNPAQDWGSRLTAILRTCDSVFHNICCAASVILLSTLLLVWEVTQAHRIVGTSKGTRRQGDPVMGNRLNTAGSNVNKYTFS